MDSEAQASQLPGWHLCDLDFPTFRMALLAKAMDRLTIRQLSENFGLSYAQWRVMARLGTAPGGATVGQIAQQAWADRAEVSRAVSWLQQKNLLSRREHAEDRRVQVVSLTQEGESLYRKVLATRADFHRKITGDMSPEEVAQLDTLIDKLRVTVQAAMDDL